MKLQIDTVAKTIKVEGMVKFADLIKHVQILLPEGCILGAWHEYSIDCNTVIQWYNYPMIVNPVITPQRGWWEYPQPYCGDPIGQMPQFICDVNTNVGDINGGGTYSIKCGGDSPVSCLNFDTPITNYVTKQPDLITPTVFNVLLN